MVVLWGKKKKPDEEKVFHFEMKGADGELVISKRKHNNLFIPPPGVLWERTGEERERRGAFKSNNLP